MEDNDAVQKPVVVDPPLYNEAPPSNDQRRPVVDAVAALPAAFQLIQRMQRALEELRELRNQFNAILRDLEIEVGGGEEEERAESSVEDPDDDDSDS